MKTDTKKCGMCKKVKAASAFHLNNSRPCGLQGHCKACRKAAAQRILTYKRDARAAAKKNAECSYSQDLDKLEDFDMEKEVIRNGKVFHFSAIYCAQSRSGKTTNLVFQLNKIRKYYDIIIMISESMHAAIYKNFKFDLLTTGSKGNYQKIIKFVRRFQKLTNNKVNFLIVLDDFARKQCKVIRNLYSNGRNSSISIVHCVQSVTMLNNHCRYNALYVFLFSQKNAEAIERVYTYWLKNFVKAPENIRTQWGKKKYVMDWFLKESRDFTSIVLNIDAGKIMKSKAVKLD